MSENIKISRAKIIDVPRGTQDQSLSRLELRRVVRTRGTERLILVRLVKVAVSARETARNPGRLLLRGMEVCVVSIDVRCLRVRVCVLFLLLRLGGTARGAVRISFFHVWISFVHGARSLLRSSSSSVARDAATSTSEAAARRK